MILLENKADTAKATLSQLLLGNNKKGDGNAFGKMLKELTADGKEPLKKELALLLNLEEGGAKTKPLGKSLSDLLHGTKEAVELTADEKSDIELLHPKLTRNLPLQELRTLVQNAREHLKEQIREITDVKEMPKTLKGLIQLAQKIGVDIEKISLEQMPGHKAVSVLQAIDAPQATSAKTAITPPTEHMTAQLVQSKQEKKPKEAEESKHEPLRKLLQNTEKPLCDLAQNDKKSLRDLAQNDTKSTPKQAIPTDKPMMASAGLPVEATANESAAAHSKQPLFASTLSQLLHGGGEEAKTQESDTAPVEQGGQKNTQSLSTVAKADPLQLKINEAKEMVRHFAVDLKEAVQNYKPPFTRIKIQLNPGKLGEVDVTMVQRGNNVHININSNPAAINTLAQNATELKTQLAQNGLANATMNFNSGSNPQQQQHQQRNASALYEQLEQMEDFDFPEHLEIIVPRYV